MALGKAGRLKDGCVCQLHHGGVCEGERGARLHGEHPFVFQAREGIAVCTAQLLVLLEVAETARESVSRIRSARSPAALVQLDVQLLALEEATRECDRLNSL